MIDIDDMFAETDVLATAEVARAREMGETEARSWGAELQVKKVGQSFAWTRADVEQLDEALADLEEEAEEGADDADPDDEPDDDSDAGEGEAEDEGEEAN